MWEREGEGERGRERCRRLSNSSTQPRERTRYLRHRSMSGGTRSRHDLRQTCRLPGASLSSRTPARGPPFACWSCPGAHRPRIGARVHPRSPPLGTRHAALVGASNEPGVGMGRRDGTWDRAGKHRVSHCQPVYAILLVPTAVVEEGYSSDNTPPKPGRCITALLSPLLPLLRTPAPVLTAL